MQADVPDFYTSIKRYNQFARYHALEYWVRRPPLPDPHFHGNLPTLTATLPLVKPPVGNRALRRDPSGCEWLALPECLTSEILLCQWQPCGFVPACQSEFVLTPHVRDNSYRRPL